MFPFKSEPHDKDAPHDQSLAKQFLPIGCYGQEPILDRANACKLEGLQNDAAKSIMLLQIDNAAAKFSIYPASWDARMPVFLQVCW